MPPKLKVNRLSLYLTLILSPSLTPKITITCTSPPPLAHHHRHRHRRHVRSERVGLSCKLRLMVGMPLDLSASISDFMFCSKSGFSPDDVMFEIVNLESSMVEVASLLLQLWMAVAIGRWQQRLKLSDFKMTDMLDLCSYSIYERKKTHPTPIFTVIHLDL